MTKKSLNTEEGRTLAKVIYQTVFHYFQNEEHCRAFMRWYKDTYGKEYQEKKVGGNNAKL